MKVEEREIEKKTGYFKSFDGTPIYYEVRGQGQPIIMCYGIACLINHWTHQLRFFSQNYQTIAFDYRGHHNSPTPQDLDNVSIDALCRDIQFLCQHLGIRNASFWGHSFGVQVLLRCYELFPELFANMVFVNGFASNPIKNMFGVQFIPQLYELFREFYEKYPQPIHKAWQYFVGNPFSAQLAALAGGFNLNVVRINDIEVYARGLAHLDLKCFLRLFQNMMEYDGHPVLSKVSVPVLVLSGSQDGVTPYENQLRLHHLLPKSEFMRIAFGSHCTQLDLPEVVNLRIEKFLQEQGYSR